MDTLCHHADIARPGEDTTNSGGSIEVLTKVGAVLDLLAERGELAAAEIAALTGEPRSSVYRILGSLESLDMVESGSRRGSFRLGLGLLRLGNAVVERFDEREAALPALQELNQLTGETAFLCVRRGYEAVCIERLPGEHVESLALRLGGALPLHAGAAPRTLLAFEPRATGRTGSWIFIMPVPDFPTTKQCSQNALCAVCCSVETCEWGKDSVPAFSPQKQTYFSIWRISSKVHVAFSLSNAMQLLADWLMTTATRAIPKPHRSSCLPCALGICTG